MKIIYDRLHELGPRENQEDHLDMSPVDTSRYVFVVSDGMGGHAAGEVASHIVVSTTLRYVMKMRKLLAQDPGTVIRKAILEAYQAIQNRPMKRNMGATLVLALIDLENRRLGISWVGDSRAYWAQKSNTRPRMYLDPHATQVARMHRPPIPMASVHVKDHPWSLWLLTRDHTFVWRTLVDQGVLGVEEIRSHPMKNRLSLAISTQAEEEELASHVRYHELEIPAQGGILCLCTDGVWESLSSEELLRCLVQGDVEEPAKAAACIRARVERTQKDLGHGDNYTAWIVAISSKDETPIGGTSQLPTTVAPPVKQDWRKKDRPETRWRRKGVWRAWLQKIAIRKPWISRRPKMFLWLFLLLVIMGSGMWIGWHLGSRSSRSSRPVDRPPSTQPHPERSSSSQKRTPSQNGQNGQNSASHKTAPSAERQKHPQTGSRGKTARPIPSRGGTTRHTPKFLFRVVVTSQRGTDKAEAFLCCELLNLCGGEGKCPKNHFVFADVQEFRDLLKTGGFESLLPHLSDCMRERTSFQRFLRSPKIPDRFWVIGNASGAVYAFHFTQVDSVFHLDQVKSCTIKQP